MSFDWQTQEEISWEEPPPLEEEPLDPGPRRRRWPYVVLMVLVGAAAAAFVVVRELNRRVDDAQTEARLAVISSYNVIQQAAVEADAELFVSFLSGRDADWSGAQERAVQEGAFLNREGLGLYRMGEASLGSDTADVTFSPDLTSAEMTVTQTYGVAIGHGLTETVRLRQTAVYRLGPNRWLLAPPELEFWGEMETRHGRYLTTTYPERDAAIGRRLASDLDRKLIEMCEQIAGLNCPADLQVTLDLTTDPNSLLPLNRTNIPLGQRNISLPTPTLAGLPLDEHGYRALQRGYGQRLVTAVISDLVGWVCCSQEIFYEAIVNKQLQQLGLKTSSPLDYERVQDNATRLADFLGLWDTTNESAQPEDGEMVYGLIEFLTSEVGVTTPQMQRELGEVTYRNWLLNVVGERYPSFDDLEQEWQRFLDERTK